MFYFLHLISLNQEQRKCSASLSHGVLVQFRKLLLGEFHEVVGLINTFSYLRRKQSRRSYRCTRKRPHLRWGETGRFHHPPLGSTAPAVLPCASLLHQARRRSWARGLDEARSLVCSSCAAASLHHQARRRSSLPLWSACFMTDKTHYWGKHRCVVVVVSWWAKGGRVKSNLKTPKSTKRDNSQHYSWHRSLYIQHFVKHGMVQDQP